ncbi:MAG TPA: YerC/YecD family TrpR-related protein [Steroidobacteraceae bacterium]|nr:YerC/YecD family TrpR-related protein [Steroidobacteraceae bacterium]
MKLHRNLSSQQEAAAERSLFGAVACLRTPEECRAFFRDLCTPAELQAMADRWAAVEWLQRGLPYREIHRLTGVSVTTIGRVARYLSNGNGGYALAARRMIGQRPAGAAGNGDAASRRSNAAGHADASAPRRVPADTPRPRAPRRPEALRHE